MQKKVSVVIPFYSHKEWLLESLESVFNQSYKDFEVILVNDGSKEDITSILKKYEGDIYYFEQENKGPAAARNLGLLHATGEYIAFEDSDDIWLPTKLETQIKFMEDRGLQWSHTGFYYWWPDKDEVKAINVNNDYGDIYLQRYISCKMATPCVIIKRDFLSSSGLRFPEQYRNGEDGALWSELAKLAPVGLVQEPLSKIRMRGTNSYSHAIERFRLGAESYIKLRNSNNKIPRGIVHIKKIYYIYSKLFTGKITPIKEFIAKCIWTFPYIIERLYVKKLIKKSDKSDKYILRRNI